MEDESQINSLLFFKTNEYYINFACWLNINLQGCKMKSFWPFVSNKLSWTKYTKVMESHVIGNGY